MDRLTETEELKSSMMLESIVEIGGNMVKQSIHRFFLIKMLVQLKDNIAISEFLKRSRAPL